MSSTLIGCKLIFSFELCQTSSTIAPAHLLTPENRR